MESKQRSNLALGLILILVGLWFLAGRLFPGFETWLGITYSWPLLIIAVGVFLLLIGLIQGTPDTAIGAFTVAGIGGILYWQNLTGRWESWGYLWTLIPGFAGLGTIVSGLIGGDGRRAFGRGLRQILISLVLFVALGSLIGGLNILGPYWPVLLIALGAYIMLRAIIQGE
jgi:hypothetical protein